MHLETHLRSIRLHRGLNAVVVAAALAVGAVTVPLTMASAAPAATKPAAGRIHVLIVATSATATSAKVLVTGAFSDHGTLSFKTSSGKHATLDLTKGAITVDKAGTGVNPKPDLASCSIYGTKTGRGTFVKGTGAYKGIKGTISVTTTEAGEFPRLANGKCNTSNSAVPVAFDFIVNASAKASF